MSFPVTPSPLLRLPTSQWTDVIRYLTADDLKSLRLIGSREPRLSAPPLTSHLQLRMDRAPFFLRNVEFTELETGKWLANRRHLIINDAHAPICSRRVAYLISRGYLNSITQIIVHDCHAHAHIVTLLSVLPNAQCLKLIDQGNPEEISNVRIRNDLELMVAAVGRMTSLEALDIEVDCVISGRNLMFLQNLYGLKHLRLRGFDLSRGIENMANLIQLESLHLCHGNFYSSPEEDVREEDLLHLMQLRNVKNLHLEGFDCLSDTGLKPFSPSSIMKNLTLKHCQEMNQDCLQSVGKMTSLESLHIVNSAFDDIDIENFESENWVYLNDIQNLKRLSLFYVLVDQYDLLDLSGLTALETLNIAFHDSMDQNAFDELCQNILPKFPCLTKLRIFSDEGGMEYTVQRGAVEIEFSTFNFGDEVELD
ncbi:hypothetical protein ACHAWO_001915 [Cyclotella atomus]|jgi:hypothetical protein|uniref:F-box domain-containing protein n=1 Tax=Cyclotella atomus TaxID=382360 RepID=A0ABD3P1R0_9STRA